MNNADLQRLARATQEASEKLEAKYPNLHPITLLIMAGDFAQIPFADEMYEKLCRSVPPTVAAMKSAILLGSYARLEWLCDKYDAGILDDNWLVDQFPSEWVAADPDDTDLRYLTMWLKARKLHGKRIVDGKDLPLKGTKITLYRGQDAPSGTPGWAWTIDLSVAKKFATGAGSRVRKRGCITQCRVYPGRVLAYMTGRGEHECIIDPRDIQTTFHSFVSP